MGVPSSDYTGKGEFEMDSKFSRTQVGGVSLPRMIMGTNWILGYSHTGNAADSHIRYLYQTKEDVFPVFEAYLSHGVDAVMGPVSGSTMMAEAVQYAQEKTGKKIHIIDTPVINVDDSTQARRDAEALIRKSAAIDSTFCLIHHASCEQLINKNKGTLDRLPDYLSMIRENGLIPGLSAHMPEVMLYSDKNGYDVETYIQIFNCMGFLMQVEVEAIARVIHNAKKPVMTIKPMAAGRVTPYVGLTFSWNAIRPCDMVTVGAMTANEALEDIEISCAALEHRLPVLEGRSSPAKQAALGKIPGDDEKKQK